MFAGEFGSQELMTNPRRKREICIGGRMNHERVLGVMLMLDFVRKTFPISRRISCSARILHSANPLILRGARCVFMRLDNHKSKPIYLGSNV